MGHLNDLGQGHSALSASASSPAEAESVCGGRNRSVAAACTVPRDINCCYCYNSSITISGRALVAWILYK